MADKEQKLFTDFAPITTEEWEAKINADLKGKDYERSLVWKTYEGFNVRPYYRQENLAGKDYLESLPGEFPYVRGNNKTNNDWFIRQNIFVTDFEEANKKALEVLGKGITSLGFLFSECGSVTKESLGVLLKDICLEAAEVNLVCPCDNNHCAEAFAAYVSEGNWDNDKVIASASLDPIGTFTLKGKIEEDAVAKLVPAVEAAKAVKNFRVIGVHGKFFANSGSSIVQELAFALAQGAEYLTQLTEAGVSVDDAANAIKFNMGISNNYFMEIAKLRAGRLLWSKIVEAYGPECKCSAKMIVHSETNRFNKTVYDPYVNMLRTQTEAMSATLGGAHSVTVLPFNAVYEETTPFSERIARNQQILLKEESHFDKIADPSAGSYYIETLTEALADQAWELFLTVQEKGGFIAAFKEGFVQAEVKAMAEDRNKKIAQRRENILGTNQFPNFTENMKADFDGSLFEAVDLAEEGAEVETLKPYRGAQPFEALRYTTDMYARENKRPLAFMLTMGNLAFRKARAQFSCNFFAVAGFDVQDNNGFATVEEGVAAAKAAGADIVVVCSSDDEYAEIVPAVAEQLGEEILVVAGAPACADELKAKGITNFIHVKSNILEELKGYQEKLGI
ncbi:methylmalonyl-CoA mutase family protein [Draconibacterium orientale]|jgi:methylmalonyl-CoA mutase|uniref:methylmalonyl-CoA mutase family protein n=1 Tax=Draconibacterium orientale TaxID=1168034 RepID=UPI002A0A4A33|nr:methylmalonyl-CoA mutase family protein [Draconibacterium orientale]